MGIVEILLGVAFPLLVGLGVALAVLSDATAGEAWFARGCFIAAATDLLGLTVYRLYTPNKLSENWRLAFAALVGLVIVPAALRSLLWVDSRAARVTLKAQPVPVSKPRSASKIPEEGSPAWPDYEAREHLKDPKKLTLHDLFLTDFPGTQKAGGHWTLSRSNKSAAVVIEECAVINLETNTKLIEVYIPYFEDTYGVCVTVANTYEKVLAQADEFVMSQKPWGGSALHSSKEAVFSKTIFIYHESEMRPEQIGDLTKLFDAKGLHVDFRGSSYLSFRKMQAQIEEHEQ